MLIPLKLYGVISNIGDDFIDIKDDFNKKAKTIVDYILSNPDKVILTVGTITSLLKASQSLVVSHRNYSQRKYSEMSYYDSHSHTRWFLKRQLTNFEKKMINNRVSNGESAVDILEEMGVLR